MRWLRCVVLLLAITLAGCATPPPTMEGRVSSVSAKDIEEITAVVRHNMVRDFWHVVPIDRIEVLDHDNVVVYYQNENILYNVPIERVRGVWTFPRVMVTDDAVLDSRIRPNHTIQLTPSRIAFTFYHD